MCSKQNSFIVGGTDIISCFMGQNVTIPVYKGEIQARNLGMAVEAWNDEGKFLMPNRHTYEIQQ